MDKYISKEWITNLLENHLDHWCGPEHYTCSIILDEIEEAPTVAILSGRWIPCENGGYYCSNCDRRAAFLVHNSYCPNCGCKMDGEENGM